MNPGAVRYDFVIIGGGIIGLSTAWQLLQCRPDRSVLLVEKESTVAMHQTGHNSGVIHAGVYYAPDSLKAEFCRHGLVETLSFCKSHSIRYEQCGKLLVATNQVEHTRMLALYERCRQNNIECELLDQRQLRQLEPCISGIAAILVPSTGIVNYRQICAQLAILIRQKGGVLQFNTTVQSIRENDRAVTLQTSQGPIEAGFLICCAGLQADRLAAMHGLRTDFRIVPFRGEYYRLPDAWSERIRHLIYPVPDPALPFLGIHLTRMIDGTITVGPNAVPGFKREGYGRMNFSPRDTVAMLGYAGFWNVARANARNAVTELANSSWKRGYLRQVQKYCPSIQLDELLPYPPGVRAQAVLRDGTLVHDFLFAESPRSLHVCNAPSPGATSAFPIGNYLCERIVSKVAS